MRINTFIVVVLLAAASSFATDKVPAQRSNTVKHPDTDSRLEVAAIRFSTMAEVGDPTYGHTGSKVTEVAEPLKTTVLLLSQGELRVCIVATATWSNSLVVNSYLRDVMAKQLGISQDHVLIFSSHNHSVPKVASGDLAAYRSYENKDAPGTVFKLYPFGEKLVTQLRNSAKRLPGMLEPVSVWYAEGTEGRITYNRKGRRADGSTYFMREEDRVLLGKDFNGDIDRQAPVVVLKNQAAEPIGALVQFTGHPVTSYRPEQPIVFGEWTQISCDVVAAHLGSTADFPVGFMQGCAGDVSSKEMFCGGTERATEFGHMLGQSYLAALEGLRPSRRDGLDYAVETVQVPLAPLPPKQMLVNELAEMKDFVRRAKAGDEDTLSCVGLNFPRALSAPYRAALVDAIRPWNEWALKLYAGGREQTIPHHLKMELYVIRLGDVSIVGMPCEPFLGIGRQIRRGTTLPLAIPCGYTNDSYGYITDAPNTGDREYMSSFYRYTRFRPPLKKPAGDVIAAKAVHVLARFSQPH